MANTTASTLITRCLDSLSRSSTGTTRSGSTLSTEALAWLNRVQFRISRRHDFKELFKRYSASTVTSTKTYNFPTNYKVVVDLVIIDGSSSTKLTVVLPQHFEKVIPYPENWTTRRPQWYVPFGSNFDLYPIPDAIYTLKIRTIQLPTVLTASTEAVSYTPDKDDILFTGMMVEGFSHLQMYEDAALWNKEFLTRLGEAISVEEHMPDYVPVGRGYDSGQDNIAIADYWLSPFISRDL